MPEVAVVQPAVPEARAVELAVSEAAAVEPSAPVSPGPPELVIPATILSPAHLARFQNLGLSDESFQHVLSDIERLGWVEQPDRIDMYLRGLESALLPDL